MPKKRLDKIVEKWSCILKIINEELISVERFSQLLDKINAPKSLAEIGVDENIIKEIFVYTKDIRDKYVLSRLCWDLGIIDSISL